MQILGPNNKAGWQTKLDWIPDNRGGCKVERLANKGLLSNIIGGISGVVMQFHIKTKLNIRAETQHKQRLRQ